MINKWKRNEQESGVCVMNKLWLIFRSRLSIILSEKIIMMLHYTRTYCWRMSTRILIHTTVYVEFRNNKTITIVITKTNRRSSIHLNIFISYCQNLSPFHSPSIYSRHTLCIVNHRENSFAPRQTFSEFFFSQNFDIGIW